MQPNIQALRHHYANATPKQVRDGRSWYKLALVTATEMALRYNVTVSTAAAVIAALSPRKSWAQNLKLAHELLNGGEPRTIGAHLRTAQKILAGDRLSTSPCVHLRGKKTRAFFYAIMAGGDHSVVVDVWMLRALGMATNKLTPKQYDEVAQIIHCEAFAAGELPAEYQAIVWCAIRGKSF